MKSTKGQTNSLVSRFEKDLKKDNGEMNEAMDLTIKPRKNVIYTFRNRVQIGGEDSDDTLKDTTQNTVSAKLSRQNTKTMKMETQEILNRTKETKGQTTKYNTNTVDSDSNMWTKRNSSQYNKMGDTDLFETDKNNYDTNLASVPETSGMKIKVNGSLH